MYTRVEESAHEATVQHYQVAGASLAIVINWLLVYITFNTESGGLLSLLGATFALVVAAGLAEIRTSVFDKRSRLLTITRRRMLGPVTSTVPFNEVAQLSEQRLGNEHYGLESVRLQTTEGDDISIGKYVIFRGTGGGLKQYLEAWLQD